MLFEYKKISKVEKLIQSFTVFTAPLWKPSRRKTQGDYPYIPYLANIYCLFPWSLPFPPLSGKIPDFTGWKHVVKNYIFWSVASMQFYILQTISYFIARNDFFVTNCFLINAEIRKIHGQKRNKIQLYDRLGQEDKRCLQKSDVKVNKRLTFGSPLG